MGGESYREAPDKLSTLASFSACEKHTRLETAALLSEVLRGQPIKHNKTITKDGFKLNNSLTQIVPYIFDCFNVKKIFLSLILFCRTQEVFILDWYILFLVKNHMHNFRLTFYAEN